MNISYDSYRVFYYAAKYRSFTQAAALLGGSQPNVTRSMKLLEAALGCQLFIRSRRGVRLTPEGETLYGHIAVAFEHIQAGEDEIASMQGMRGGVVTVAASGIALRCCLLPVLKDYRNKYPNVRVRVSNHASPQSIAVLQDGLADLAVVTMPRHLPKNLRRWKLAEIQEIPVAGTAFDALAGRMLTLVDLADCPLVGLGPHSAAFDFYSQLFSSQGLPYQPDIETATSDQILPMVRSNLGVGFVPESFAQDGIRSGTLLPLTLRTPLPKRAVCLIQQEHQPLSAAARELEAMLKSS